MDINYFCEISIITSYDLGQINDVWIFSLESRISQWLKENEVIPTNIGFMNKSGNIHVFFLRDDNPVSVNPKIRDVILSFLEELHQGRATIVLFSLNTLKSSLVTRIAPLFQYLADCTGVEVKGQSLVFSVRSNSIIDVVEQMYKRRLSMIVDKVNTFVKRNVLVLDSISDAERWNFDILSTESSSVIGQPNKEAWACYRDLDVKGLLSGSPIKIGIPVYPSMAKILLNNMNMYHIISFGELYCSFNSLHELKEVMRLVQLR